MSRLGKIPGISVGKRGTTYAYRLTIEEDPVTGERRREYRGGYASEEDAWRDAIEAKKRLEFGRSPHPTNQKVDDYFHEWLEVVESSLKPTTAQNYRDNIDAYIVPLLGKRSLRDLTVPVVNAFYKRLHESGRRKTDGNQRMYAYWKDHASERGGQGPRAAEIADACGTKIDAAREAIRRYRRGRTPAEHTAGLSIKSIRNVHVVMRRALDDAVAWGHLHTNPAAHTVLPRQREQHRSRQRGAVWTAEQLGAWLRVALTDRYAGMWVLAATTGMRRSELAGVHRSMIDLDEGLLVVEDTRVVVGGRAHDSDGKSSAGRREIALDTFTAAQLRSFIATLDEERDAFGETYPGHGYLMVGPEGRRMHPDTITARFNRLVDKADVPRIRLHDVRHTYATLALDAGVNIKTLSDRIGHADTSVTMQLYTHHSRGRDRGLAQTMGDLIQGTTQEPERPTGERSGTDLGTPRLDM